MKPKRFFHVDLDAFFASVKQNDNPDLKGKPVIVGAQPGHRGVVSTCSYEARAFGVRSAMPISEAYRRCPQGVYVTPRIGRYSELSAQVMEVFSSFTPEVQRVSIDEAFLDMTGTERLWGEPEVAARLVKAKVLERTGLGISIGVAPNRYVAKIASGLGKPNGLVIVPPEGVKTFMLRLPLSKLWGAGEKTQARFRELGIMSIAQLASFGEAQLWSAFRLGGGRLPVRGCAGTRPRDDGPRLRRDGEPASRSMSAETTFERDCLDRECVEDVLMYLASELAYRLWSEGCRSRTLVLKLRLHDFTTSTRRRARRCYYLSSAEAFKDALALLEKAWDGRTEIRLLGLGFAAIEKGDAVAQGELFSKGELFADEGSIPGGPERQRRAEEAVFDIERRGLGKVTRARLLGRDGRGRPDPESGPRG